MKQRLITGIIAGAVFLGLCFIGGLWYHLLILAMALIGYYEFVRMTNTAPFGGTAWIGYVGVFLFVFPWGPLQLNFNMPWGHVLWLLLLLFMLVTVITKNTIDIKRVSLLFLASAYIGIGFSFIAESRHAPDAHGVFWTFLLLVSIWASDAGAYFVGRSMGRHKLWPSISPNKTVEGALGGVLIAVLSALLFAFFSDGLLTAGQAVLIGLSCAVIGQLGDLVQSAYKRVYGIKDSGKLLPGHGGILDRCDSWIVVFPFVHILGLLPY